jgi:hypothetical protein
VYSVYATSVLLLPCTDQSSGACNVGRYCPSHRTCVQVQPMMPPHAEAPADEAHLLCWKKRKPCMLVYSPSPRTLLLPLRRETLAVHHPPLRADAYPKRLPVPRSLKIPPSRQACRTGACQGEQQAARQSGALHMAAGSEPRRRRRQWPPAAPLAPATQPAQPLWIQVVLKDGAVGRHSGCDSSLLLLLQPRPRCLPALAPQQPLLLLLVSPPRHPSRRCQTRC